MPRGAVFMLHVHIHLDGVEEQGASGDENSLCGDERVHNGVALLDITAVDLVPMTWSLVIVGQEHCRRHHPTAPSPHATPSADHEFSFRIYEFAHRRHRYSSTSSQAPYHRLAIIPSFRARLVPVVPCMHGIYGLPGSAPQLLAATQPCLLGGCLAPPHFEIGYDIGLPLHSRVGAWRLPRCPSLQRVSRRRRKERISIAIKRRRRRRGKCRERRRTRWCI